MTNKLALISSFCNSDQKINVLRKNIEILKTKGLDVLVISPIDLPVELINKCDYFFRTKDNPVLDWPVKSIFMWKDYYLNNKKLRMSRTFPDYGWAGLYQVKIMSKIALSLGYDKFYHMIYDLKIDDNVIEGINSDRVCNVYPSKRGNTIWDVGLHFMIFDRKNLEEFISHISLESYLRDTHFDAFVWLHRLNDVFPYTIETRPVEDEIFYFDGLDLFDYSPSTKLKFFIENDKKNIKNIKMFFYHIDPGVEVSLTVNDKQYEKNIYQFLIADLGMIESDIENISLIVNDEKFNITNIVKEIKHSTIEFEGLN